MFHVCFSITSPGSFPINLKYLSWWVSLQIWLWDSKFGLPEYFLFEMYTLFQEFSKVKSIVLAFSYRLIDQEGFHEDTDLLCKLSKNVPKSKSYLKRDLDCRAHSEAFRATFRLPPDEKLDGTINCAMWTPFNKRQEKGTLYLSNNYVCFKSKVCLNWSNEIITIIYKRDTIYHIVEI